MIYKITSSMDATMYEDSLTKNTGLDPILEIRNYEDDDDLYYTSRILSKFDLSKISELITAGTITSPEFYLNYYVTETNEIPLSYSLYAYPVSESWAMGVGKFNYSPITTTGVSWTWRDEVDGNAWATSSFADYSTGSNNGGGTWYTSSQAEQSFDYQSADLRMDVTDIVNDWLSGSYDNNGFVIKRAFAQEESTSSFGSVKFYSKDTNTIYQPRLEVKWDDSNYASESLSPVISGTTLIDDINITMRRMRPKYNVAEKARFRINPRELYPVRTFATSSAQMTVKYLPETSYYSVVDINGGLEVVPFDTDYTKLSCDTNGNYFDLWIDQLEPARYYKILFKIVDDTGFERIFENRYMFEVVN